jgi:hypothetical protein
MIYLDKKYRNLHHMSLHTLKILIISSLMCAGSATAAGSNVWGVGIATKLGHTVGLFSGVAEASVRFNKIEIAAGVMNGSDSIRDNVDGSSYVVPLSTTSTLRQSISMRRLCYSNSIP